MLTLAAASAAHLRGVAAGLYLEFLHRVGRGAQVQRVESGVGIGGAIEQKIVRVGPVAADAHRGTLSRPPVERIHVAGLRAVAHVRAGNGQHQVDQHAAVERKVADGDRLNDFAHRRVGRMQRGRDVADFDDVLHGSDFEAEVQRHLLGHLKAQALGEGRKPGSLHLEFIITGGQSGDLENSLVVAGDVAHGLRAGRRAQTSAPAKALPCGSLIVPPNTA